MKIVVKGLTKEIRNWARMIKTELEKEPENIIIRVRSEYNNLYRNAYYTW